MDPQPRKRPRSSYRRFQAAQPNECWQSDFTHWRLTDGADVEILNWLDDHSRRLLHCTAHPRVTGPLVIASFLRAISRYGPPASTLTDNGVVYTARFVNGRNGFEHLLADLAITQKNGHPGPTGQQLSTHHIDPARAYWRNQQRSPGRWPGPAPTSTMTRDIRQR